MRNFRLNGRNNEHDIHVVDRIMSSAGIYCRYLATDDLQFRRGGGDGRWVVDLIIIQG